MCVLGASLLVFAGETIDARESASARAARRTPLTSARIEALRSRIASSGRRALAQPARIELEPAEPEPGASRDEPWSLDWNIAATLRSRRLEVDSSCALTDGSIALLFEEAREQQLDHVEALHAALATSAFEPRWDITPDFFATARIRELGTYGVDEDFRSADELLARRSEAFGFDTQRFQRISAGLGWIPKPGTLLKLEGGRDRFPSTETRRDERMFVGLELVVSF